jgi:hypothetical protein
MTALPILHLYQTADRRGDRGERLRYIGAQGNPPAHIPLDWEEMTLDELWERSNREHPTPQATIEAIMFAVRARGVAALREPANIERLLRCGVAAKAEVNRRIAGLIAAKEIAA